jgi:hypothetical protein
MRRDNHFIQDLTSHPIPTTQALGVACKKEEGRRKKDIITFDSTVMIRKRKKERQPLFVHTTAHN